MHRESLRYMKDAFVRHALVRPAGKVLDIGASGKRAWYRDIWQDGGWTYDGLDMADRPNVDIVLDDPWKFPLEDDSYDAVISGQMLEHNEFFWLTFLEMARVLKMGGLMIHIAPSRGMEHRDPQDCWRFYRDGMDALAKWSGLDVLEATTDWAPEHFGYAKRFPKHRRRVPELQETMRNEDTDWGDTVGIFVKTTETSDAMGMQYVRHFADLHSGQSSAKRRAAG